MSCLYFDQPTAYGSFMGYPPSSSDGGYKVWHSGDGAARPSLASPGSSKSAVFILEIAAALLSVPALRDGILGGPAMSLEAFSAIGLWASSWWSRAASPSASAAAEEC
jgi:hypothetical protein